MTKEEENLDTDDDFASDAEEAAAEVRGLERHADGFYRLAAGWRNIALKTEYDGTNFSGWQRQADRIRTVQGTLEKALAKIMGHPITLYASSRTDGGVHSVGHISNFRTNNRIPADRIPLASLAHLPADIVIKKAYDVDGEFNARYHATSKTYSYYIWQSRQPAAVLGRYSYHVPVELDLELMQMAADDLIGYHDFSCFKAMGGQTKTSTREIFAASVEVVGNAGAASGDGLIFAGGEKGRLIRIIVTGSGFLYNMMRIIAGTLLYIGLGKIAADAIPGIIASGDRLQAGSTLPPQGLFLEEVLYDGFATNSLDKEKTDE